MDNPTEELLRSIHVQLEHLLEAEGANSRQRDRICLALAALASVSGPQGNTAELMLQELGATRCRELVGQLASALAESSELAESFEEDEVGVVTVVANLLAPVQGNGARRSGG